LLSIARLLVIRTSYHERHYWSAVEKEDKERH